MENFISGLATGVALMLVRDIPALAWKRPGLLRYLLRDGASTVRYIGAIGMAACLGWMISDGFRSWHAMVGVLAGFVLTWVPSLLRDALTIAENVNREEAHESRRQRAAAKATFKPYEPLRARRRW